MSAELPRGAAAAAAQIDTARFAAGPESRPPSVITNWIDFTAGFNQSREALGVWIQNGSAWKIYAKETNAKKTVVAALQTARNANLPLVPIQAIAAGGVAEPTSGDVASPRDSVKKTYGFCVRTQYRSSPWVFFSAQKTGGISKFESELKKITSKDVLLAFKAGLEIAVKIKLSDPQGFINPTSTSPAIEFMDIHIGSDSAAKQLLETVDARIKQLGS